MRYQDLMERSSAEPVGVGALLFLPVSTDIQLVLYLALGTV